MSFQYIEQRWFSPLDERHEWLMVFEWVNFSSLSTIDQWFVSFGCKSKQFIVYLGWNANQSQFNGNIEGDKNIPFLDRRIGRGILWSPSVDEEAILAKDWSEFALMISTGRLSEINASMGDYLQIRPKAATAKSLCYGFDEVGNKIQTLPRGFYLRCGFTKNILWG